MIFPTIRVMKSCMNHQMDGQTTSPLHHRIRNIYKTDINIGMLPIPVVARSRLSLGSKMTGMRGVSNTI